MLRTPAAERRLPSAPPSIAGCWTRRRRSPGP